MRRFFIHPAFLKDERDESGWSRRIAAAFHLYRVGQLERGWDSVRR